MPLGTQQNPYKIAPSDWNKNGVPYGAFCECHKCGRIDRSTFTFDYSAKAPGDLLACQPCFYTAELGHGNFDVPKEVMDAVDQDIEVAELFPRRQT